MSKAKSKNLLIPLKDYERVYRSIHSIIQAEGGATAHACLYFSFMGAEILRKHYKIDAMVNGGAAVIHTGNSKKQTAFGRIKDGYFLSDRDAFHIWIEADGWMIDFMAPNFPSLPEADNSMPSYMLQKQLKNVVVNFDGLIEQGDVYLQPNHDLLKELGNYFLSHAMNKDLMNVVCKWYRRPPKKMQKTFELLDQNGVKNKVNYLGKSVVGAW